MYRQYENPHNVKEMLDNAIRQLDVAKARGDEPEDMIDLALEVESLRDRLRFAYDDEEYDMNYCD